MTVHEYMYPGLECCNRSYFLRLFIILIAEKNIIIFGPVRAHMIETDGVL